MKASRYAGPAFLGALVLLAFGVVWYARQPRGPDDVSSMLRAERRPQPPSPVGGAFRFETAPPNWGGFSGNPVPAPNNKPPEGQGATVDWAAFGRRMAEAREYETGCGTNVKRLTAALRMYTMDYDEHLPIADKWCDATYPYVMSGDLFHCPAAGDYGYALNRKLTVISVADVAIPARTVLLFESSAKAKNASDAGETLCRPPRHFGGNSLGYLDGHAVTSPIADRSRLNWR